MRTFYGMMMVFLMLIFLAVFSYVISCVTQEDEFIFKNNKNSSNNDIVVGDKGIEMIVNEIRKLDTPEDIDISMYLCGKLDRSVKTPEISTLCLKAKIEDKKSLKREFSSDK